MRLTEFRISNFQRVKVARIRPNGVTTIGGANSHGKTSALRGLWTLLLGRAAGTVRPIKDGEEQCTLYGEVGDSSRVEYRITRTFTRTDDDDVTMSLKVEAGDGKPITRKVETVLKELLGEGGIQFDPLAWARSEPKVQFDAIKRLVPGFNFEKNAAARQEAYDARTDVNRQAKAERARADGIELPPGKPKALDGAALLREYQEAVNHNTGIERERMRVAAIEGDIRRKRERAAALRAEADQLEIEAGDLEEAHVVGATEAAPIDLEPLKKRLLEAEHAKGTQAQYERKAQHLAETAKLEEQSAALTARIEALDRAKAEAIAAAKIAVPGMSIGDNEVLLNGRPFSIAGTREKLVAAVGVSMLLNPMLRVMTIDEGSEIDSEGLAILADLAEANDFDVLIARVDEAGASDFVIQNGEMREGGKL